MGNLGWYQLMTTVAKRVGGPKMLAGIVAVSGYVGGKIIEIPVKGLFSMTKKEKDPEKEYPLYTINKSAEDKKQKLILNEGDQFRVLESDGNAILIEVLGNDNNPYFVDSEFLAGVSNYEAP